MKTTAILYLIICGITLITIMYSLLGIKGIISIISGIFIALGIAKSIEILV